MNTTWATAELRYADLGDRRLDTRLARLVAALADRPEASVPQATQTWAATKAAYRFWDNDRIDADDILAAHRRAALDRLPSAGPLLAIQDTTALDFAAHPATAGLGYLTAEGNRGLLAHSTLLASAEGVPLGLLDQHVWARPAQQRGKRRDRRRKETADKESQRWLDALAGVGRHLPADREVLVVGDREADFYDLFASPRRPGVHLLVRAKGRRRLWREAGLLGNVMRTAPAVGTMAVPLRRGDDRPARTAVLTLRMRQVRIAPPSTHPRRKELPPLSLTAVLAVEEASPTGAAPLCWLLLTTRPAADRLATESLVRWYALRWLIERYHYVLKSGCRIEELQLGSAERLRRALATYAVVAWRLLWLAYEARRGPGQSVEVVLRAEEEAVLRAEFGRPASAPLTVGEATVLLARLGGFLARKHDGPPGVRVLWRGLRRLGDLVKGWELAHGRQPPHDLVGNA
jgi:hypothetical protein